MTCLRLCFSNEDDELRQKASNEKIAYFPETIGTHFFGIFYKLSNTFARIVRLVSTPAAAHLARARRQKLSLFQIINFLFNKTLLLTVCERDKLCHHGRVKRAETRSIIWKNIASLVRARDYATMFKRDFPFCFKTTPRTPVQQVTPLKPLLW